MQGLSLLTFYTVKLSGKDNSKDDYNNWIWQQGFARALIHNSLKPSSLASVAAIIFTLNILGNCLNYM